MKLEEGRATDFISLPADEAERTLEALKQAEAANDIEALKWCARRLAWLDGASQIISGDDSFYPAHIFNKTWAEMLKSDSPPESIAAIIARIDEDEPEKEITAADAEKALDTVKAFFEENIPRKVIAAALQSVEAMREAVKTAVEKAGSEQ
jgi:hypothetical protein